MNAEITKQLPFFSALKSEDKKRVIYEKMCRLETIRALRLTTTREQEIKKHPPGRLQQIEKIRTKVVDEIETMELLASKLGCAYFDIRNAVDLIREMRNESYQEPVEDKALEWLMGIYV